MNKEPNIKNVKIGAVTPTRYSLQGECDGARYSFWCDIKTGELVKAAHKHSGLYKNPPEGVTRYQPGFFATRYLNPDAAANRPLVDEMIRVARENMLLPQKLAEIEERERLAAAAYDEAQKDQAIADAAPDLAAALKAFVDAEAEDYHIPKSVVAQAIAALQKAGLFGEEE